MPKQEIKQHRIYGELNPICSEKKQNKPVFRLMAHSNAKFIKHGEPERGPLFPAFFFEVRAMPRKPGEKWLRLEREKNRPARLEDQRRYNRTRPERHNFYWTARWRKLRDWYRLRHPLCEDCEERGLTVEANVVDHILPIEEGGDPMAVSNLRSLCHSCHDKEYYGGEG